MSAVQIRLTVVVLLLGAGLSFVSPVPPVSAQESAQTAAPVVESIQVDGLYRVTPGSASRYIYQEVGAALDVPTITEDIKRLYGSGFFSDVQVTQRAERDGIALHYQVVERPTIDQIRFEGNDELDLEEIQKVVDIKPLSILSTPRIQANARKIEDLYTEEGYYLASVSHRLVEKPDNLVDLIFVIQEGSEVEVKTITFLGNKALSDQKLKENMATREGSIFSFLNQAGQFNEEAFRQDVERLRFIYQDNGHIKATIGDPVVTLSPNRKHIHITIPVTEGDAYTVKSVDAIGDFVGPKEEVLKKIKLTPGELFRYSLMTEGSLAIADIYKDEGYANASVANSTRIDEEEKSIEFTYVIQKGEKVYYRFIDVVGNTSTRDKVVRRELLISEGELSNGTRMKLSKAEVMRLGFFEDVQITTRGTGDPDTVDVVVRVKERETGTFQIGAGFSSLESFILNAQISKQNLFGNGQTLAFQAQVSGIRSLFNISFQEPYLFDSNVTFGIELYNMATSYNDFVRESSGGSLSLGYRLMRRLHFGMSYKLESVDVRIGGFSGNTGVTLANYFRDGVTSSVRSTLTYDARNDRMFPSDGHYLQASSEWADGALGSDNEFLRLQGNARYYTPLFWKAVFKVNSTVGYVVPTGGKPLSIYERYFMGGIFNVRGFERNSLGPAILVAALRDPGTSLREFRIGGNKQLYTNAEIEAPIFPAVGIRAVTFFDAGQAYPEQALINLYDFRYSSGFGIRWFSPVGPLRFEWGFPINPRSDEESMVFEFTIGNSF